MPSLWYKPCVLRPPPPSSLHGGSHFFPCHVQGTPVRIVSVSSAAHQMDGLDLDDLHFKKRKYSAWKAYGQSKLCNVLYAKELAHRYPVSTVAKILLSSLAAGLLCCHITLLLYCTALLSGGSAIILHCCCTALHCYQVAVLLACTMIISIITNAC